MKGDTKMMKYDIYPCDLDPMGECPKRCQDCANCVGWYEADVDASLAEGGDRDD